MDVFDKIDEIVSEEIYVKTLTYSNVSLGTEFGDIGSFKVPAEYSAVIYEIDADNTVDAEVDFLKEDASLGAKYGLPIKTKAISQPTKLGIKVESGANIKIKGRGIGAAVTLGYLRVTVVFKKKK